MLNEDGKEILKLVATTAQELGDGFDWSDFISIGKDAPAAYSGWREGVDSIKEAMLTEEGRTEIEVYFDENFDLADDRKEAQIEYYVEAALIIFKGIELHS